MKRIVTDSPSFECPEWIDMCICCRGQKYCEDLGYRRFFHALETAPAFAKDIVAHHANGRIVGNDLRRWHESELAFCMEPGNLSLRC